MIKVFTLAQNEQWDNVVKSFRQHDVYWLSGYVTAFKLHGDGEPMLIYYEDDTVRGINVVLKRDISNDKNFTGILPKNEYFDFATPYGYGGWIVEGENTDALFSAYEEWCIENGIISEFVRFHPVLGNQIYSEKDYQVIPLGQTVAMKLDSPELIWANISSKNRNMIRKAEKSGVEIKIANTKEIYEAFTDIYNKTMEHDNAEEYYYFKSDFYDSIRCDLGENSKVFYATKDDMVIAASIIIYENGYLNYHLSGSLLQYRNLAPSNLLLYKAAVWGSENGCKSFHLGGGVGSGEDNLFKFKKSFYRGDDLCRFCIGKKIFMLNKYDELLALRDGVNSTFFPEYRA